jgi:hypothetical protein
MSEQHVLQPHDQETPYEASASVSTKQKMPLKARLIRYYQKYNPTHISKIDYILDLYDHDETALFQDLLARYGPEDIDRNDGNMVSSSEVIRETAAAAAPGPFPSREQSRRTSLIAPDAAKDDPAPAAPQNHQQKLPPPLTSPSQHSQSDPMAMSSAFFDMPDASSPYHRSESKRRFPDASTASEPSASFSLAPLQSRQGDVVYDGAFSPNRRRAPRTLGTLFSHEVAPGAQPNPYDVAAEGRWAATGAATPRDTAGTSAAAGVGGSGASRHVATPGSTQSDALISDVTSVVYRHDAQLLAKEHARRIVDAAKKNASIGFLANTTSLVMQRSAAAEMYAQHLETLRDPAAYSARAMQIRNQRLGTAQQQQQDPVGAPMVAQALSMRPAVIPPVRALQSTLNIDEMSSYRALADYQRSEMARLESPDALLQHPRAAAAGGQRSATSEGGLFFESWQAKPLQGKRIAFEGSDGNRQFASGAAEQIKSRLRAIHTSPLVSMQRARLQAQAVKSRGYAKFDENDEQHQQSHHSSDYEQGNVSGHGSGALFHHNTSLDGAAPDNADLELQPIDMICTECGMVCKIVPGREHEFVHEH